MQIYFVTSNSGKVSTLQKGFEIFGRSDIEIIQKNLDIIEPQLDSFAEVSKYKAKQAFDILQSPLVVEDGGLSIEALNGFPGVYSKYVIDAIGVEGILKLLAGEKNRVATFTSFTTFVDENGSIYQFERDRIEYKITEDAKSINSPFAWSELWKIIYVEPFGKTLCELTEQELENFYQNSYKGDSLQKFIHWFTGKY